MDRPAHHGPPRRHRHRRQTHPLQGTLVAVQPCVPSAAVGRRCVHVPTSTGSAGAPFRTDRSGAGEHWAPWDRSRRPVLQRPPAVVGDVGLFLGRPARDVELEDFERGRDTSVHEVQHVATPLEDAPAVPDVRAARSMCARFPPPIRDTPPARKSLPARERRLVGTSTRRPLGTAEHVSPPRRGREEAPEQSGGRRGHSWALSRAGRRLAASGRRDLRTCPDRPAEAQFETGQTTAKARPVTFVSGTVPLTRESPELDRWSPITNNSPSGTSTSNVVTDGSSPGRR